MNQLNVFETVSSASVLVAPLSLQNTLASPMATVALTGSDHSPS